VELLRVLAMKNLKVNHFIYGLAIISLLTYFIILQFWPVQENTFLNHLKIVPRVVTVDTVIAILFAKYAWKWRVFKGWLVPFPNLNGTFQGTIQSTWVDPHTGSRPAPIPAILTIHQTFFSVSCVMRTAEMVSRSFISDFIVDEDNQVKKLAYSYTSIPTQVVMERSAQHDGTIVFEIDDSSKIRLFGQYWTARKTTGTIDLEFYIEEKLNSFPSKELAKHPVSEIRNNKS
jgi:SMODS-associating 2TM, beta-strand rich effector domain